MKTLTTLFILFFASLLASEAIQKKCPEILGTEYVVEINANIINDGKRRYIYEYDNNRKISKETALNFDGENWQNYTESTYSYNSNGDLTYYLNEYWTNINWMLSHRERYRYDENNQLIEMVEEKFDDGEWVLREKYRYTYNQDGTVAGYLSDFYLFNKLRQFRYFFTYNTKGNETVKLCEIYEDEVWEFFSRASSSYDDNGNLTCFRIEDWKSNSWVDKFEYTYTYDSKGNLLESRSEIFIDDNWANTDRETYTYNQDNFEISFLSENWQDGQWNNDERTFRTYDASNNLSSITHERWLDDEWVRFSDRYTIFEFSDSYINSYAFSDYDKIEITWQEITSVLEQNPAIFTSAAPNPFSESTEIKYTLKEPAQVSIAFYDNMGNMISSEQLGQMDTGEHSHQFSSGNLSQGMYYYLIRIGNQSQSGKLVIVK